MRKQITFKTKGMQRDLAVSAFNPEFAYENMNMRIVNTDENTLLSLVNEKGPKQLDILGLGNIINGTVIGQSVLDDNLVLFSCDSINNENKVDRIYKLWFEDGNLNGKELFAGNLGFDITHPIETVVFYENESLKKVYWTDGLNSPRVINIAEAESKIQEWNNKSFDFVRTLKLEEDVTITKNTAGGGMFAPGALQYVFTYFDKYGQESNIFYQSPLFYTSFSDRGGSPEDKVSNSFNIDIKNLDTSFDYVRIYSILRTSINSTPEVKKVVDIEVPTSGEITYTDNGTNGDSVDPTELLYVGGEDVIFGTMTQKDNTLFLGDIEVKRKVLDDTVKRFFKGNDVITFKANKEIEYPDATGYYPYKNQLYNDSFHIKTFKYLEYYRFGVQFQHYTGKWSEPVFIEDKQNNVHIDVSNFYDSNNIQLTTAEGVFNLSDEILTDLKTEGYIKIRPVIVYPTINDRECICQGVLCPTVYNVSDRYSNSPFAQSSWFTRPNAPFDLNSHLSWSGFDSSAISKYSVNGILSNDVKDVILSDTSSVRIDSVNNGAWVTFMHGKPIPGNDKRNAEIQCISNPPDNPYTQQDITKESDTVSWVAKNAEYYYIDQNIITLHSPDIEYDNDVKCLDLSNMKLRIVGMVPITACASDIDIQTSTTVNNFKDSTELPQGFYKEPIGTENNFKETKNGASYFGWRCLISGAFWFDELSGYKKDVKNTNKLTTGFVVYPWHRNGSLNNTKYATDGYRSAMLDKKKMSNLRFSYKTAYLDKNNIWFAYEDNDDLHTGISGAVLFDSNEVSLVKLPAQKNSGLSDINYYGNIDKLLTASRIDEDKKDGYPIITSGIQNLGESTGIENSHSLFVGNYTQVSSDYSSQTTGTDPVRIKYKSTPHVVMALNFTSDHAQRVLPTIYDGQYLSEWTVNSVDGSLNGMYPYWDKNKKISSISQDIIETGIAGDTYHKSISYGWLWLGELYNDNVKNRFGGDTEEALENNLWLPCGEAVTLPNTDSSDKSVKVVWTEGDTYFQRYDHIKTYPYTLEDQNSITDIISFMCETRVNLDGRYDKNRGQTSNLVMTPTNFNLVNNVYSQDNNFFNYRTVNANKLNLNKFHNTITWTKTKTAGELVDNWTNITLASTLDLDGDKGPIRALKRLNDQIIAFQDKGISQILYNENTQITTTEGVPIEIANSGKVTGKRYFTDSIGCSNKWSICDSPSGLYFIDDISKGIYLFNGKLDNLSSRLGFSSWMNKNCRTGASWNPKDFSGFVSYYDNTNKDVLFINEDYCLAFSEPLAQFSSFYNYEHTPYFVNVEDKGLWIKDNKMWLHNGGDYNIFFDNYKPFYTTVIANQDVLIDKMFSTVEFRADSWDTNNTLLSTTFDTLHTENEYQEGESTLTNVPYNTTNLKKRFRIWKANIPRDKKNNFDRMRNTWLYVTLKMKNENRNKTILHDLTVHYFE